MKTEIHLVNFIVFFQYKKHHMCNVWWLFFPFIRRLYNGDNNSFVITFLLCLSQNLKSMQCIVWIEFADPKNIMALNDRELKKLRLWNLRLQPLSI